MANVPHDVPVANDITALIKKIKPIEKAGEITPSDFCYIGTGI